jgi:DNA-binding CsgD family transcriptional regulator
MSKDFGHISDRDWDAIAQRFRLTPRERQVLREALAGRKIAEMEKTLNQSHETVLAHLNSLYRKTGASDRVDLAMRVMGAVAR